MSELIGNIADIFDNDDFYIFKLLPNSMFPILITNQTGLNKGDFFIIVNGKDYDQDERITYPIFESTERYYLNNSISQPLNTNRTIEVDWAEYKQELKQTITFKIKAIEGRNIELIQCSESELVFGDMFVSGPALPEDGSTDQPEDPNSIFRIKVFVGAGFGDYRSNFRNLEELYIKDRPFRNLQTLTSEIVGNMNDIATDSYYASQWC